ncbi:protein FAM161B [Amphiprion ocellaris]|uniref:FAM161 centrosomal protein B n=1 Tax=Amphiprion ocellaris TaxID=80972 RepID=A0A3Q1B395_AMPOC|nr:protein FAM161B [Amphiprion ocellaris]XP_035813973.1 protein FAM161B [Amphiprion ocellaris]
MPKLETLVEDRLRSEQMLQLHLKALRKTLRQQLQETHRRQTEELEKRIHLDALLSTDVDRESDVQKTHNHPTKHVEMRRSASTFANKETSHSPKQPERPNTSSPAWVSSTNRKHCSVRTQECERLVLSKTTQLTKEEEAEAECQQKFCALPVPSHVVQPIYQEMMEQRERERKQSHEQRRQFLLSIQKPFRFQEREKEKREKLVAMLNQDSHDQKNSVTPVKKLPHKDEKDLPDSELQGQEEGCRKVHAQTKLQQKNPTSTSSTKLRTAERTRKEKLGFLDEQPSFQPKIIHQVPNFHRLHKALQTEALKKTQSKDVTRCQPFNLRTSALPARQSRMSPETSQAPKMSNLSRSKSLGALISSATLPTYITDATRKRSMAIRKSMELRDIKNEESADWMRNHQLRSQAMKKTVTLHAKLLDPHRSLKEVFYEKLQHHREADQQRMREYMRELRAMKARVSERPYLFEQAKQRNAKAHAEQTYRSTLMNAGLKEQFVEENGEALRSEDDTDLNDCSTENDIHSREENVDDGEKIEDVEEKSVKSKGEEMP